jgi:hypothetical protein
MESFVVPLYDSPPSSPPCPIVLPLTCNSMGQELVPRMPLYEVKAQKLQPCVVLLNYVGEGEPGPLDLASEDKKWSCLLCEESFVRAFQLHEHVAWFHTPLYNAFIEGKTPVIQLCSRCGQYYLSVPLLFLFCIVELILASFTEFCRLGFQNLV